MTDILGNGLPSVSGFRELGSAPQVSTVSLKHAVRGEQRAVCFAVVCSTVQGIGIPCGELLNLDVVPRSEMPKKPGFRLLRLHASTIARTTQASVVAMTTFIQLAMLVSLFVTMALDPTQHRVVILRRPQSSLLRLLTAGSGGECATDRLHDPAAPRLARDDLVPLTSSPQESSRRYPRTGTR